VLLDFCLLYNLIIKKTTLVGFVIKEEQMQEKKKMSKQKKIIIVILVIVILTIAQLVILGAKGGIGPLKFMKHNQMAKLPGNAQMYHPENVSPHETSPLAGKHLLFLGSSVTNGSASLEVSMADYIGILNDCEITKEAANGTTLADKNGSSYLSRLKKIDRSLEFDAVIVQLSTNDASQKIELGKISDSKNSSDFDASTIVGSMESIIAYSYDTWDCPVIFYTGTKYNSTEYQAMIDILPSLQEKWEIGIIDLWNDADMNSISKDDYNFYMNDNIHPTQAGYLLWWTPKFESYLYEFLE